MIHWFKPDALEKSQEESISKPTDSLDPNFDFDSYRLLNSGKVEESMISEHNNTSPELMIEFIFNFLRTQGIKLENSSILNLGCGAGFESLEIQRVFNAELTAIDISVHAIEFARKNHFHKKINYLSSKIDSNLTLESKYDCAMAIEFYPFTRSNDYVFIKSVLEGIKSNLKPGGWILICHIFDNPNSIKPVLEKFYNWGSDYRISRPFHPKIYGIFKSLFLTNLICWTIDKLSKNPRSRRVILFRV